MSQEEILKQLKKQLWVEDYDVGNAELQKITDTLAFHARMTKDARAMLKRISIDGSERSRITKLVGQTRKFHETLKKATRHGGVQLYLSDASYRVDGDIATPSSLQRLVDACELSLAEATPRKRGAPTKGGQIWLILQLTERIRKILISRTKTLEIELQLDWDRGTAEAARIVVEILAVVGIRVIAKTVQNLVARS